MSETIHISKEEIDRWEDLLNECGISRRKFADKTGIHYDTYSRIVKKRSCSRATYEKICKIMGEVMDIYGG